MKNCTPPRQRQTGAYLLEALIGILIFALGILGIVGLQAASLRTTADSSLRAEAVFAANQLLGQMWTDNRANLDQNYASAIQGQPYKDFASQLKSAQGGAWVADPQVIFDTVPPPSTTSRMVTIAIFWQSETGDANAVCGAIKCHNYTTSGVIATN